MTLRHSLPLLEVRSQAQGLIEGYASVFGGVDSYGDTVSPGAFARSIAAHKAAGTAPVMLWAHQADSPIGRWVSLAEDARGLKVAGQLNLQTAAGRDAFEHLRARDITGLSIGYPLSTAVGEKSGDVNVLKRLDLAEISIVSLPADSDARVNVIKAAPQKPGTVRELERALLTLGYSRKEAAHVALHGFGEPENLSPSNDDMAAVQQALQSFQKSFN